MKTHHAAISMTWVNVVLLLIAILFAASATILIILSTSAATVTGASPFIAISVVDAANTGILGPGEERWYKLNSDRSQPTAPSEESLTLFFTPGNGIRRDRIGLEIFEENQLQFFYPGDASRMANLGAGQIVERDNNPETGELFWTGWLPGQRSYYIQLTNGSETAIDYWLFAADISGYPLGEPEKPHLVQPLITPQIEPTPTPPATGDNPLAAISLANNHNRGNLNPGEESWYRFTITDADAEYFEEMALTMVTTPDNGQRVWQMSFEIFTSSDIQRWLEGNSSQINNIGAGSVVDRDNNPLTGERVWRGWIVEGEVYYVRIRNSADIPLDYWLFTGDIYNPELGQEGAE
jgi:hypothetical protein